MTQVTLIALYGQKPTELTELVGEFQDELQTELGDKFHRYELQQVHATIIGLERVGGSAMLNLNFAQKRNQEKTMDFEGLLNFMRTGAGGRLPFQAQIGGFENRDYPFVSRDERPYDRSFSIQGDNAVLMGWPVRGKPIATEDRLAAGDPRTVHLIRESRIYPATLDEIRRALQTFNTLHAYHREITAVDNDFYFRIGLVDISSLEPSAQKEIEHAMRAKLSARQPVILDVTLSIIQVASYEHETLPPKSSKALSVSDHQVNPEYLWSLYD